jgi:crotonobetainyl-CoA:carnitine CoA-transferase CaiB-like acyl-CoA transferase
VTLFDGTSATMVATPVDFSGRSRCGDLATPELGQDTEAVLLELGWDWDRIALLKEAGVI